MELLPAFKLHRPATVEEAVALHGGADDARYVAGGTDLLVNVRRGIERPAVVVSLERIDELKGIVAADDGLTIGAAVRLATLANDEVLRRNYAAVAEAAGAVAGPTHRQYGTLGGNLCLDTRCIYYNQSEWWRSANDYCLKHRGDVCHVAPGGKTCFAAFSGDVAPAMLVYDAEVTIAGPDGRRRAPLASLYRNDGLDHLTLKPGELLVAAHLPQATAGRPSVYAKSRIRGSIDFPLAGVAVAYVDEEVRVALTGVSPQPFVVGKTDAADLDALKERVQSQAKAMKTTTVPPHYRRRVAGALARRLAERLAS
jgi:4-hydroxybenzoyl-CoA reductase subunit beta